MESAAVREFGNRTCDLRPSSDVKNAPPALGFAYALLIAVSTLRGYFHLVELPWFATQVCYMGVILLSSLWVFYSGQLSRIGTSYRAVLLQMLPVLASLIWSMGLWVAREEPLSLIRRGSSMTVYQLLLFVMIGAAAVMFGSRTIEYTSAGFILANTLILLDVMRRNGIGATVSGMASFLMSFGSADNDISVQLEVQDVTFGIAILLFYYLFCGKNEPRRLLNIAALTFFFLLGFKRILFPAMFAAGAYLLLMRRMSVRNQKNFTLAISLLVIALSLAYVALIRMDLLTEILKRFGINLMGRDRLYGHMKPYYQFSPGYLGLGNGMVSTVLEAAEASGNRRLHNDVLRLYIELGMPVFLLWKFLTFVYPYLRFRKTRSARVANIYMAVTLLMFVTFLTDNTLEKYCPELAWHLLPVALILQEREEGVPDGETAALNNKNSEEKIKRTYLIPEQKSKGSSGTRKLTPAQELRRFREERNRERRQ